MLVRTGTSGFSYKEWKGSFYPEDLPAKDMLGYYASQLSAVEINNTFYRMPNASVLESWAEQVPDDFRFVLKASRRITHFKRLGNVGEETAYLIDTAATLGDNLAALLFQLPPNMKKDSERLRDFLGLLPPKPRAAFEFRHASWYEDDVFELLREHDRALCIVDDDDKAPARVATAGWGYLRLRRGRYTLKDLRGWQSWTGEQAWSDVMLFFKHEDQGAGPRLAARYLELDRRA